MDPIRGRKKSKFVAQPFPAGRERTPAGGIPALGILKDSGRPAEPRAGGNSRGDVPEAGGEAPDGVDDEFLLCVLLRRAVCGESAAKRDNVITSSGRLGMPGPFEAIGPSVCEPGQRQSFLHRRTVASTPPAFAAEGREPCPSCGHARTDHHSRGGVTERTCYANISGRSSPLSSIIVSAGMLRRFAASRIASALGASYRQ